MKQFNIHHVGARFGNTPFSIPQKFVDSIETIMYDADIDCVGEMVRIDELSNSLFPRRIVSACLSDYDGTAEFRLTVNASASSMLEPSEAASGFIQSLFGVDWDVADCAKVIERRSTKCFRLDTLLRLHPDISTPDFLSLDTQGSELSILKGASGALGDSIVGLMVEVEFIELYSGGPRFGDISGYLEEHGFHFAGFHQMINAQANRQSIGMHGRGFPIAADALFLRRIDFFENRRNAKALKRLAFASLMFGHADHAFSALLKLTESEMYESGSSMAEFLFELWSAIQSSPMIYLPKFPDILPEQHYARFSIEPDIRHWPMMFELNGWNEQYLIKGVKVQDVLSGMESKQDSAIEAVLRKHGFFDVADNVNFRRRDQAHKLLILLSGGIVG
jgi:FkbM family methyltransferase